MTKPCFRCGCPADEGDRFCRACGAALAGDDAEQSDGVFVLKAGTARLEEGPSHTPPAPLPPPPPKPTRREKRIAKKLALEAEKEGAAEDYIYPEPVKKRGSFKGKLLSLCVAALLVAALVGALYLRQAVEQAAFSPIETAYEGFNTHSLATVGAAYHPALHNALTDLGVDVRSEELQNWQAVYGSALTATPRLRSVSWMRGAERDDRLRRLETEYALSLDPPVLLRVDYTTVITAKDADASVRKSALVGYVDGRWYLLHVKTF